VDGAFFTALSEARIAWGFVSGAEPSSARYVLEKRLGLQAPPLIAMGEAPDKPDPTGLLRLAAALAGTGLGTGAPPVAYLGDTVADVQTVMRARQLVPGQALFSLAVAPPHLHVPEQQGARRRYEQRLLEAGADRLLSSTAALSPRELLGWLSAPAPQPT
jgi:HAD superfamily phosphatase